MSNKLIALYALFAFPLFSGAQSENPAFPFNELGVSANYTFDVSDDYPVKNGIGGGLAVYRSWRTDKKVNLVTGIDYNFTSFKTDSVFDNPGYYFRDGRFRHHQFRIPFSVRFQMGTTTTFFIEPGAYINFLLAGSMRGTGITAPTGETAPQTVTQHLQPGFDPGLLLGIGIQIPCTGGYLIFKADVNKGLGRTPTAQGTPNESFFFYNSFTRLSVIFSRR